MNVARTVRPRWMRWVNLLVSPPLSAPSPRHCKRGNWKRKSNAPSSPAQPHTLPQQIRKHGRSVIERHLLEPEREDERDGTDEVLAALEGVEGVEGEGEGEGVVSGFGEAGGRKFDFGNEGRVDGDEGENERSSVVVKDAQIREREGTHWK